jgi:exopolysaccharide production protein ExoQ
MTVPRQFLQHLSETYTVFVFMLSTYAFVSIFVRDTTVGASEGSLVFKCAWGFVYVVSLLRIIRRRHEVVRLLQGNKMLVSLILLAICSFRWSIDPAATLLSGAKLVLTTFFAIDISLRYSIKRQLHLLCTALVIVMVLSVIVELFIPGFVPTEPAEAGAWHGVFEFKNDFGRVICLSVVVALALCRSSIWLRGLIFASGLSIAVFSKSVSAVGYTVALVGALVMWSVFKWKPVPRACAILLLGTIGFFSVNYISDNWAQLLAKMDKDPHMTGRVDLWEYSIAAIQQRPMLGYGYAAFWGYDSQPARRIREAVNWPEAPHAHNAYIDYALSLGLVGLVTYSLLYLIVARRAFQLFMSGAEYYLRWPLTYLVFVLVYQCTESGIFGGNNLLWIVFSSLAFSLTLERQEFTVQDAQEAPGLIVSSVVYSDGR